jgi:hypothetical protein
VLSLNYTYAETWCLDREFGQTNTDLSRITVDMPVLNSKRLQKNMLSSSLVASEIFTHRSGFLSTVILDKSVSTLKAVSPDRHLSTTCGVVAELYLCRDLNSKRLQKNMLSSSLVASEIFTHRSGFLDTLPKLRRD